MTNHVRRQIRDSVMSTLAGLVTTGARVYQNRVYPVKETPGLIVYNGDESSEPETIGTRKVNRILNLNIEGYASSDNALDQIAKEVEVALSADETLGGIAIDSYLIATTFEFSDGDTPAGVVTLTYQVQYRTLITAPDVAI